jgi:hypothetical protein
MNLDYESLTKVYNEYRQAFVPFSGTTRDDYLKWRKEWREAYEDLSNEIRRLKSCRKQMPGRTEEMQMNAATFTRYLANIACFALQYRVDSKVKATENYFNMKKANAA